MSAGGRVRVITAVFLVNTLIWVLINVVSGHTPVLGGPGFHYGVKGFLITLNSMIFLAGFWGWVNSRGWGGLKSAMGRAVMFLSLGMISWAAGNTIWIWYLFYAHVEIPYPSFTDVAFILSYPLWTYGVWQLSKATGAKFGLRSMSGKVMLVLVPVLAAFLSYYLLVVVARGGMIDLSVEGWQLAFDLFYPLGDLLLFSIVGTVFLLSRRFLGGRYQKAIFLLFVGFVGSYISDFAFSYTTHVETYFNAGAVDYLFVISYYVISLGLVSLDPRSGDQSRV